MFEQADWRKRLELKHAELLDPIALGDPEAVMKVREDPVRLVRIPLQQFHRETLTDHSDHGSTEAQPFRAFHGTSTAALPSILFSGDVHRSHTHTNGHCCIWVSRAFEDASHYAEPLRVYSDDNEQRFLQVILEVVVYRAKVGHFRENGKSGPKRPIFMLREGWLALTAVIFKFCKKQPWTHRGEVRSPEALQGLELFRPLRDDAKVFSCWDPYPIGFVRVAGLISLGEKPRLFRHNERRNISPSPSSTRCDSVNKERCHSEKAASDVSLREPLRDNRSHQHSGRSRSPGGRQRRVQRSPLRRIRRERESHNRTERNSSGNKDYLDAPWRRKV